MKKLATILKLNVAGHGYTLKVLPQLDPDALRSAELLLPNTDYFMNYDKRAIEPDLRIPLIPCISYSFSPLWPTKHEQLFLGSIGCYWLNRVDQSDRPGLSFWHAFVATSSMESPHDSYKAAEFLRYLVEIYQSEFQQIGNMLSEAATNPRANVEKLVSELMGIEHNYQLAGDVLILDLVERVKPQLESLDPWLNLSIPFPFSPLLAIPILVDLSIRRRVNIAGGMVAGAELKNYQFVSVPIALSTHRTINLASIDPFGTKVLWNENNLVDKSQPVARTESQQMATATKTNTQDTRHEQVARTHLPAMRRLPLSSIVWVVLLVLIIIILFFAVLVSRGLL